jgi:hypothetical protein
MRPAVVMCFTWGHAQGEPQKGKRGRKTSPGNPGHIQHQAYFSGCTKGRLHVNKTCNRRAKAGEQAHPPHLHEADPGEASFPVNQHDLYSRTEPGHLPVSDRSSSWATSAVPNCCGGSMVVLSTTFITYMYMQHLMYGAISACLPRVFGSHPTSQHDEAQPLGSDPNGLRCLLPPR